MKPAAEVALMKAYSYKINKIALTKEQTYNSKNHYDVVMIGLFRSDQLLSSTTISIAAEWSKNRNVYYIDRPYSLKDFWVERQTSDIKSKFNKWGKRKYSWRKHTNTDGSSFIVILTPLLIPCAFLPNGWLYDLLNGINNIIIKRSIVKVLKQFNVQQYVFVNSFLPSVKPTLLNNCPNKPLLTIYQTLDDISQESYIAKHGVKEEIKAFLTCELGIASSTGLSKKYFNLIRKKVEVVANAADFKLFENAKNKDIQMPEELTGLTGKIILYTGHYSNLRFNHKLVLKIAKKFSNCNLVFVGSYAREDVIAHGLDKFPNIYFFGLKPISMLPAYIKYSDVAIIPYAKNTLTSNIYPLKINEYLAAGIPVVTSNFSEDISAFKNVAYVADNDEMFLSGIENALNESQNHLLAQRIETANNNSWQNRIEKLEKLIHRKIHNQDDDDFDVIMTGLVRNNNFISSSALSLAKEWSKTRRVIFIDRPFSLKDILFSMLHPLVKTELISILFRLNTYRKKQFSNTFYYYYISYVILPINFLPHNGVYNFFLNINRKLLQISLKRVIKHYKIKKYVFYNSFFPVFTLNNKMQNKPMVSIYQTLDEITQEKYIAKHGKYLEIEALKTFDIALASSSYLSQKYTKQLNKQVHNLFNGVDYDLFYNAINRNLPLPEVLSNIPKPIVLFTGHISELRINIDLVKKLAHALNNEASIVFTGTYNKNEIKQSGLTQIHNIYFTGNVRIEDLPALLQHSKVGIIPYACNELTAGIYPLKVNEYLASGIPCVTTNFSPDIKKFDQYINIAETEDEFIKYVKYWIKNPTETGSQERMQIAKQNAWSKRIEQIENLIKEFKINKPLH
jgi:glycosyltransferase involved in cell wall biosynthesis